MSTPLFSRALPFALLLATALTACTSIGPASGPVPTLERAEQSAQQGRHAEAARIYEALAAERSGAAAIDMQLRAARAWLDARQPDAAGRALAAARVGASPAQAFEAQMLGVELRIARGDAQRAWSEVSAMAQPAARADAARYLDVRQQAAFATGRHAEGVRAQIAREPLLPTLEAQRRSRSELLADLRAALEGGAKVNPAAEADPTVRGWLELAPIAVTAATMPTTVGPALQHWRGRYPSHPANDVVRSDIEMIEAPQARDRASHVALLLPVSGRQAGAAAQIRDGFFTAYYRSPAGTRPQVRVYDTASTSIAEAISRASAAGATVIVGPLLRDEVAAAAGYIGPRPALLALNFLGADDITPANFYQYALSPENEARSIAGRLTSQGLRRGVALVPVGEWGTRVLAAFTEALQAAGGELVGTATYFPAENDYSPAITDLLRIDASKARHRRIEQVTGTKLAFQPRRRGDAQFIFAPSQAQTARLLRPQLRFHYAGDLPTYSTSDAYEPHPTANQDLDGLIFPDMPWVFGVGAKSAEVRESLVGAWGESGAARGKLFAFGHDAYQLSIAIASGAPVDIDGLTGRLRIDDGRRVYRQLEWAQIKGGQTMLLDAGMPAVTP
ncbi:MAG TPA: penicillin-binding protein activator [Steroidobacteraceae bacterium]|nr:penicillin-binding protein activator [Steroidobacteraceae bacterium]HNS27798.1 penicillin-binding protein activator [Steroidobacteraceae bacterium]